MAAGIGSMHWVDIIIVIAYFAIVIGVGIWSSRKSRSSVSSFFLAGRSMHWIPVGASILLSNLGSEHVLGLAGSGAATGFAMGNYELLATYAILFMGWFFLPVYIASGIYTMPEYLQKRYGGQRIQLFLSIYSLLAYVVTKVSVSLFAGSLFIEEALGWNMYISIAILLCIACVFTVVGGLTAVMWTDSIQSVIFLVGSFVLMGLALNYVGGLGGLMNQYVSGRPSILGSGSSTCGLPPVDAYHLVQDPYTGTLPWPGIFFGATVANIWYWCTDQVIVQRALAAKNIAHGKAGCILAAYAKILPFFLFILPGMASRILFPDEVGCVDPDHCERMCGSRAGCTNRAFPQLVMKLMPIGMRGIMLAVILSAVVSSLSGIFNSASTLFTMDVYRRIRKNAHEIELVLVGRVFVVVLVALSILWVPVIHASKGSQLFDYLQTIQAYIAPPIAVIFFMGIFVPRVNERGAFWGMMSGFGIGILRFIFEFFIYKASSCGEANRQPWWIRLHFTYYSIFITVVCIIVTLVISLLTKPIPAEQMYRLTFWSRFSRRPRVERSEDQRDPSESTAAKQAEIAQTDQQSKWLRYLRVLCCVSKEEIAETSQEPISSDQAQIELFNMVSIEESSKMRMITCANGILLLVSVILSGKNPILLTKL